MMKEGQKAPTFVLPSSDGSTVDLSDLRGTIVVLYFYPKDMTPGCTIEAENFRDALPALKKLGAVVLGVSRDSVETHCRFRDRYDLTFPLLTDADAKVMGAYGAWGDKLMYGKKVTGVIRSTVVIDKDGNVVRHWPKVSVKGHVDEVVATVAALAGGKPVTTATTATTATAAPGPAPQRAARPAPARAAKPARAKQPTAAKPRANRRRTSAAARKPAGTSNRGRR